MDKVERAVEKRDCHNVPISQRLAEEEKEKERKERMIEDTKNFIESICEDGSLVEKSFVFVEFQDFFHADPEKANAGDPKYYPCEVRFLLHFFSSSFYQI